MKHDERTIPDWELALYRLGELPAARAEALSHMLATDPVLAARLASLDQREAELLERQPPRMVAARVAERVNAEKTRPTRRRGKLWWLAAELAAVALLLVWLVPWPVRQDQLDPFIDQGLRDKGVQPYLRVFRQVPEGLEELGPEDSASAGAQLQLAYVALGRAHGAVLSVDGRGAVTLHLPLESTLSEELTREGTVDLPASYMLDDAPGFERFFLVTAREPFELEPVLSAAGALAADRDHTRTAPLALPRSLDQADFLLLKEPPP